MKHSQNCEHKNDYRDVFLGVVIVYYTNPCVHTLRISRDNLTQPAIVYHARLGSRFRNSLSQVEQEN